MSEEWLDTLEVKKKFREAIRKLEQRDMSLRKEFEKETGVEYNEENSYFSCHYVEWLEKKLSDAQAEIDIHERALTLQGLLLTKMEKEVKELKKFKERIERTVHPRYWQQSR